MTMPLCLEEVTMSILTAIFQAIFQAITWVFPLSENAYSSMFHDFSSRFSGENSALTGIVHIGIALGIIIAMYKAFLSGGKEFFGIFTDLFSHKKPFANQKPGRQFTSMSLVTMAIMLLGLIPCGKGRIVYSLLNTTCYNQTLLDDGIFLAVTGLLVLLACKKMAVGNTASNVSLLPAIAVGVAGILLIPVSGLSLVGGVFCILVLLGVSKNLAFRYSAVISVPALVSMGIVELCLNTTPATVLQIILGLVLSAVSAFLSVRVLKFLVDKLYIKYIGIYDISLGVITAIIGIFELVFRSRV